MIKKFKADEFNVLVATSIGEEGLDIGEVDLIVCYDAPKTPIRMVNITCMVVTANLLYRSYNGSEELGVNEKAPFTSSLLQNERR